MTRMQEASSLFGIASDTSNPISSRLTALDLLKALKTTAKVSYPRLGIDPVALERVTAICRLSAPVVPLRTRAMKILRDTADQPRRVQVQALMDILGVNANSAYYFARTCQAAS